MFLPNGHAGFTSSTQLQAFFFFFFPILRFPIFFEFFGFFFGFFGIYTEKRKFPKISDIFKWPQCENLPQKNATQLTRLPKAQCSHMYSSLSEEWLQANQVEHIGCLTQIWSIASNFFQTTHTFLPSLPEPQNTIPQLQVEVWSID